MASRLDEARDRKRDVPSVMFALTKHMVSAAGFMDFSSLCLIFVLQFCVCVCVMKLSSSFSCFFLEDWRTKLVVGRDALQDKMVLLKSRIKK